MREVMQVIYPEHDMVAEEAREVSWMIHVVWPLDECPPLELMGHSMQKGPRLVGLLWSDHQHATDGARGGALALLQPPQLDAERLAYLVIQCADLAVASVVTHTILGDELVLGESADTPRDIFLKLRVEPARIFSVIRPRDQVGETAKHK